jgi:hypothetical protein
VLAGASVTRSDHWDHLQVVRNVLNRDPNGDLMNNGEWGFNPPLMNQWFNSNRVKEPTIRMGI